ncbi:AAA family ATPase [Streptomyces rubiginosohelvolus]|uniref:AAA family ATPase n=1 Tax=Streptomyces rubiginosohelvolus TaxID=67362 RepID=UPI0035D86657
MSGVVRAPRRLIVIAVDDYADGNADFTKGINEQVGIVTGWLTDPALGPERQFSLRRPKEKLHSVQQVHQFLNGQDIAGARRRDAIVVYITGHGQRGPNSGRHYLRFARTDDGRLPGTALTTSEVISAALGSSAEHVLVLVDSCFAGALANDVQPVLRDLTSRHNLTSLAVVTSGNFNEQPLVGSFTELLRRTLERIGTEESGFVKPHLSFREWQEALGSVQREDPGLIEARWVWPERPLSDEASLCLPNPRFEAPQDLGAAVRDLPDAAGLFDGYWRDRASGRIHSQDMGWYFSGRHHEMRTLKEFVTRGSGVLVVTGAAGSGKSALLARLVTLTDPVFLNQPDLFRVAAAVPPDERPAAGSVDAAVLARNKTPLALIEDLLRVLEAEAAPEGTAPLQALLECLTARVRENRVPTLVIDALDEAQDSLACLNDVVLPIARMRTERHEPLVRMVVGVRSSPDSSPGVAAHLVDADADELLHRLCWALEDDRLSVPVTVQRTDDPGIADDIAAYVESLLTGDEAGPYVGRHEQAGTVAREVARAVAPSFLDGRLAADQLRTALQVQDVTARAWQERLSRGTVALLHEDLHEVARQHGLPVTVLVRVLRATAFGVGSGLPWAEIWPGVAHALAAPGDSGASVEELAAAIRTVQTTRLTGYLARSEEDGRLTYRPVHQQVAKVLLEQPSSLAGTSPVAPDGDEVSPPLAEEHARITRELALLLPPSDQATAHPYVRRHLVAHAAAGHVLDDEHVPLQLLSQETSHTLRERLGLPLPEDPDENHQTNVAAAALIEPYLTDAVDPASRHSSIALHALALRYREEPQEPGATVLSPRMVWWRSATNVLATPGQFVHTLLTIDVSPGRTLIVAGTKQGVHVWDAADGRHLVDLPAGLVDDMCLVRGNSRSFLATAGRQGIAIWDPLSGLRIHHSSTPASAVHVLTDGADRWQLLSHYGYGLTRWKPDENRSEAVPLSTDETGGSLRRPTHAVIRDRRGRPLLVSVVSDGLVLRGLEDGLFLSHVRISCRDVRRLVCLRRPGRTDMVLIAGTRRLLTWDPATGQVLQVGKGPAAFPAQFDLPDGRVAIALERRRQGRVEVWELSEGDWDLVAAVTVGEITGLTTLPSADRWIVATAGEEGLRLWQPNPATSPTPPGMSVGPVTALTALRIPTADGQAHHRWIVGNAAGAAAMDLDGGNSTELAVGMVDALHPVPSGRVAVRSSTGTQIWQPPTAGDLQGWRPAPGGSHLTALRQRQSSANSCVVHWPPGSTRLARASHDGILLEDTEGETSENITGGPYQPRASYPLRALAALPTHDGTTPLLAIGTIRGVGIWDLEAGREVTRPRIRGRRRSNIQALAVLRSAGSVLLAAADRDGIYTWNTADWEPLAQIATPWTKSLASVALSPTHHVLASGSGHALHLWDPVSGELLHSLITAAPVDSIASASEDGSVSLAIGGPAGLAAFRVNLPTSEPWGWHGAV